MAINKKVIKLPPEYYSTTTTSTPPLNFEEDFSVHVSHWPKPNLNSDNIDGENYAFGSTKQQQDQFEQRKINIFTEAPVTGKFCNNLGHIYLQNTLLKPRYKNTLSI